MIGSTQLTGAAALFVYSLCGVVAAQSTADVEVSEMRLNLAASVEKVQSLQNQLELSKRQVAAMTETVTRLQTQSNAIRTELVANETKLEASAVSQRAANSDPSSGGKVIELLKELKQVREYNDSIILKGRKLVDVLEAFGQLPVEVRQITSEFSTELVAATQQNLTNKTSATASASCHSINRKLGLGIVSAGLQNGFRNGLPLNIKRGTRQIGKAVVVDARNNVCGIVLTDASDLVSADSTDEGLTAEIDQELKR